MNQEQGEYYSYYSTSNEGYSSAYDEEEINDGIELPTVIFDSEDENQNTRSENPTATSSHNTRDSTEAFTIPVFRFSNKSSRRSRRSRSNTNPGSNQSGKHIKAPQLVTTVQPELSDSESSNQLSPAPKFIELDTLSEIDYRDVMSPRNRRTKIKSIFNNEDPIIDEIEDEEVAKQSVKSNLRKASREYIKAVEEQRKRDERERNLAKKLPVPQNQRRTRTRQEPQSIDEYNTFASYYTTNNPYSQYSDYEESESYDDDDQYSDYGRPSPLGSPHSSTVQSATNIQPSTPPPPLYQASKDNLQPINENSEKQNQQSQNTQNQPQINTQQNQTGTNNNNQLQSSNPSEIDPTRKALLGVTNNEAVAKLMEDDDDIDDSFFHDLSSQEVDIKSISQAPAELQPDKGSKHAYADEAEILTDLPTLSQGVTTSLSYESQLPQPIPTKTTNPVQADDIEDIYADSDQQIDTEPENNYGKVSGSAVLDIANEAKGGKLVQALKPLNEIEREVIETEKQKVQQNRERILANIKNSTQPELVSLDTQGNSRTYTSRTYGSRRRQQKPVQNVELESTMSVDSTTYEYSRAVTTNTQQSERKSSLIQDNPPFVNQNINQKVTPASNQSPSPVQQNVNANMQNIPIQQNQPQNQKPVQNQVSETRVRRRPTRGTATSTMTATYETQTTEYTTQTTATTESNVRRRVRPTRSVRGSNANNTEQNNNANKPQQQQVSQINNKNDDERIKKLAEEADAQRKILQLENRVRPGGNERMILALPSTTTTTHEHQTEETSDANNMMMVAQIDATKTTVSEAPVQIVEKIPIGPSAARPRAAPQQPKQENVEILDPDTAIPETLSTITVTRDPSSSKADAFADGPYRPTIPTVKKNEIMKDSEQLERASGDPLSPIKGWPAFQVPLISIIDLTAERKNASIEYDFMKLLDEIRQQ